MPRRSLAALICVAAVIYLRAQPATSRGDWTSYAGTNWSQKYSPLDQITRENFSRLKVAWTWTSPDHELLKTLPKPAK